MTQNTNSQIKITSRANRTFIAEDVREAACSNVVIRDLNNLDSSSAYSLKMRFELSPKEAELVSRALRHVKSRMTSDVIGRFDIELNSEPSIVAGVQALFKRSVDGTFSSENNGSRPLVSPKMQNAIVEKLGGLLTASAAVRDNLDEDQKSAPSIPVYD